MIYKNNNRNTAIFYTCGTCNLKCEYCGIHKSPVLKEIDDILGKSFEGSYYYDRVREYFPRKDMLQSFQTWGGEPFLHMERLHPTLISLINYYPYFNSGFSSTNFSFPEWNDKFFGLMEVFSSYPHRNFKYTLQLSIDGPEYINDIGRGKGTTKKCLENFSILVDNLKNGRLSSNIELFLTIKGTLDSNTIKILNNEQKIIDYYLFLEKNFIEPIVKLNNPKINIYFNVPNTAVPAPVTKEDGVSFAEFVKLCRKIEKENEKTPIFKYYKIITPYDSNIVQENFTYKYGFNTCGTGNNEIGFLPNNMVSLCHEGFTQLVDKYTELAAKDNREASSSITFDKFLNEQAVQLSCDDNKYCEHCYKMRKFNTEGSTARLINDTSLIISLALAGQIEEIYIKEENALKAAIFMQSHTPFCIKDNYNKTGSFITQPVGLFKLLLNGAMRYLQNNNLVLET